MRTTHVVIFGMLFAIFTAVPSFAQTSANVMNDEIVNDEGYGQDDMEYYGAETGNEEIGVNAEDEGIDDLPEDDIDQNAEDMNDETDADFAVDENAQVPVLNAAK